MSLLNIAILLGVLTTLTAAATDPSNISLQLITSEDLEKFLQENPDAQPLSTQTEVVAEGRAVKAYNIGQRVRGDTLVSSGSENTNWYAPTDIRLSLKYPASGVGAIVSFVEIWVTQTSDQGRAYVVAGGIGQRTITIAVEALNTTRFNYIVKFYGY